MKTERENSHEDTKALREKRDNYFKTSCRSLSDEALAKADALVAKKGFTPLEKTVDSNLRSLLPKEEGSLRPPLSFRGSLTGFTIAELLTTIAIIAILIGILMPALSEVKKLAKETKQKAQISSIEMGINLYKNDSGDYPPSRGTLPGPYEYCGAQMLAEAMFGQDLLGFHPDSLFDPDDPNQFYVNPNDDNLRKRKGPYLQRENIGVFEPNDIFNSFQSNGLEPYKYMICDVFTVVNRTIGGKKYKVGTPVLYFRADTSRTDINPVTNIDERIYNFWENELLVAQGRVIDGKRHEDFFTGGGGNSSYEPFYTYITDPLASTTTGTNPRRRPVRPDSFLLISAGNDGFYGTADDICNFTPNVE